MFTLHVGKITNAMPFVENTLQRDANIERTTSEQHYQFIPAQNQTQKTELNSQWLGFSIVKILVEPS